jgi:hypothetical protein
MSSVAEEVSKYLIGGFTLIPALAWNDMIKSTFEIVAPTPILGGLIFKVIYAVVVSILSWICVNFVWKILSAI